VYSNRQAREVGVLAQEASHYRDSKKVSGVAASPLGQWRSVRTIAHRQPSESCGRSVKQKATTTPKRFQEEKKQKPKAEFR
jgi:hypothetical protein